VTLILNVRKEAEDIVGIRQQAMTGEDKADRRFIACGNEF
jgi:hypothetical protein